VDANDNERATRWAIIGEIVRASMALWRVTGASQTLRREALPRCWFHTGDMATLNEEGLLAHC